MPDDTTHTRVTTTDLTHLRRCIELAREALEAGDRPFGSLLVDPHGNVAFEDRNRVGGGDHTRHPEFAIARWAAENMTPDERANSRVYTTGEHCPMCSGAHAWVGLGPITYIMSARQLSSWLREWGAPQAPTAPIPITEVAPNVQAYGPVAELVDEVRELQARQHGVSL
ncbi:MAG TPA: nucleoside deaminase [Candidatus Stackebrandtia faecavium]|nr:nucleoside deaminase [Candidatus Stackebrandtia faecavium]